MAYVFEIEQLLSGFAKQKRMARRKMSIEAFLNTDPFLMHCQVGNSKRAGLPYPLNIGMFCVTDS